jgi:hypothetical protein
LFFLVSRLEEWTLCKGDEAHGNLLSWSEVVATSNRSGLSRGSIYRKILTFPHLQCPGEKKYQSMSFRLTFKKGIRKEREEIYRKNESLMGKRSSKLGKIRAKKGT